jgi:hypothetical protein
MADNGKHDKTTTNNDRKSQLATERQEAQDRGDTARVEEIDRELNAAGGTDQR